MVGGATGCTPYTSIWNTPSLTEIRCLSDFESWKVRGVRWISQLVTDDANLKPFTQ